MEYKINKRYLETLIKAKSNSIVGRVLARIESISDQDELKKVVKDTIWEENRDLLTTIEAYHNGILFSIQQKDITK